MVTSPITLNAGDVFFHVTPSGGGYGPAFARDPEHVLADVIDEKLSAGHAAAAFGVAVTGSPPRIDAAATARLRAG